MRLLWRNVTAQRTSQTSKFVQMKSPCPDARSQRQKSVSKDFCPFPALVFPSAFSLLFHYTFSRSQPLSPVFGCLSCYMVYSCLPMSVSYSFSVTSFQGCVEIRFTTSSTTDNWTAFATRNACKHIRTAQPYFFAPVTFLSPTNT